MKTLPHHVTLHDLPSNSHEICETEGQWPTLIKGHRIDFTAGEPLDRLYTDAYELFIPTRPMSITEVSGNFHRKHFHYRMGTVAFSHPKVDWRVEWEGTIEAVVLLWQPKVIQKAASKFFSEHIDELSWRQAMGDHAPAISYLGLDIASQAISGFPAGEEHVELLIEALLAMCLRRYASTKSRDTMLAGVLSRQVLQAVSFINARLTNDFSIDEICTHSAVSKSHLNRLFHNELGLSPWEFVQRQRIQKAGHLLQTTSHTIEDICGQLGFKSRSSFAKRFSREFGCTPSHHRSKKSTQSYHEQV